MIPAIFFILSGLAFGSFLNVCITRLPQGESVVTPRSHCRHCGRTLTASENIPLFSWLFLGGHCRSCKARIGWRYPAVEIATCLLFGVCYWRYGWSWETIAWATFCFLVLGLAVMDAETMLLPDWFTLTGLVLGLIVAGLRGAGSGEAPQWVSALLGVSFALASAIITAGALLLISGAYWWIRRRPGLGMGDVKMIAMLAAWLGLPRTALTFVIASLIGAAYGLLLVARAWQKSSGVRRDRGEAPSIATLAIPFGAFLGVAGLYSAFLGEWTLRWYMQFFR